MPSTQENVDACGGWKRSCSVPALPNRRRQKRGPRELPTGEHPHGHDNRDRQDPQSDTGPAADVARQVAELAIVCPARNMGHGVDEGHAGDGPAPTRATFTVVARASTCALSTPEGRGTRTHGRPSGYLLARGEVNRMHLVDWRQAADVGRLRKGGRRPALGQEASHLAAQGRGAEHSTTARAGERAPWGRGARRARQQQQQQQLGQGEACLPLSTPPANRAHQGRVHRVRGEARDGEQDDGRSVLGADGGPRAQLAVLPEATARLG
eukprot:scaffold398_cov305-Prasinococcus_capsulatus_cf.AAC.9